MAANAMTWWPDNAGRKHGWGQTLDHILAPLCTLNGSCDVQAQDMKTLQSLAGSSDHCPLWMKLRRTPNRDREAKLPHIGVEPSREQEQIFVTTNTGERFGIALHTRPVVELVVGGQIQEVMMDTGAFTTIGNPAPGFTPRTDPRFKKAFEPHPERPAHQNSVTPSIKIKGIGGGTLECYEEGFLEFGPDKEGPTKQVKVAFLPEHVPYMPRILMGLPCITGPLEGMHIRIPKEGPLRHTLVITLGAFPGRHLQCLRQRNELPTLFGIKVNDERNPPRTFEDDLEDMPEKVCEGAAKALLAAQKAICKDPSCAVCNIKSYPKQLGKRKLHCGVSSKEMPMSKSFKEDTTNAEGDDNDDEDISFKMPEMLLKFSEKGENEALKDDLKGLLDSGATINLMSKRAAAKFPSARRGKATVKIRAADGGVTSAEEAIFLNIILPNGQIHEREFVVFPGLPYDYLIGHDTLRDWKAKIDYSNESAEFEIQGNKIALSWKPTSKPRWRSALRLRSTHMQTIPARSMMAVEVSEPPAEDREFRQYKSGLTENRPGGIPELSVLEVLHKDTPNKVMVQNRSNKPVHIAKNAYIADFYNTSIDFVAIEGDNSSQTARPTAAGRGDNLQSMVGSSPAGAGLITQPAGSVSTRPPPRADIEGGGRKDPTAVTPASPRPNCPQDRENICDSRNFSYIQTEFLEQAAEEGQEATQTVCGTGAPQTGEASGEAPDGRGTCIRKAQQRKPSGNDGLSEERSDAFAFLQGSTNEPPSPGRSENMSDDEIREAFKNGNLKDVQLKLSESSCNKSELMVLMRLLVDNEDILTDGKLNYGPHTKMKHETKCIISTTTPDPMFRAYSKDWTPQDRDEIDKQVEEKLLQGIVEPSTAPWSSNVVLIRKDGRVRMAIDYRKLNSVTVKDVYPMPKVQALIDCLKGSKWLTGLDCAQAYHQIPMGDERSKDLTSFRVPGRGLLRFAYLPFGLANAGAVWSRFIDEAMQDLRFKTVLCYADDILCFTKSDKVEDHAKDLQEMFNRLRRYGIKIKASKLNLGQRELPFLGVLAGVNGVRPNPEKVKAIREAQLPKTIGQLRRVIGQFAYYRRFIPWFAEIADPLYKMVGHNKQSKRDSKNQIIFTAAQKEAFDTLKHKITTSPIVLAYPDWEAPFEIHCDASKQGLGAVLCQLVEGEERVIMYASRALTETEKKYHSYEQEALALVWSVELFRHYVYGRHFTVRSDCRSLKWLKSRTDTARVMRWVMRLQEFDFTVVHRPGRLAGNVDPLTRENTDDVAPYGEDPIEELYDTPSLPLSKDAEPKKETFGFLYMQTRSRGATVPHDQEEAATQNGSSGGKAEIEEDEESEEDVDAEGDDSEDGAPSFFKCRADLEGWTPQDFIREQNSSDNKTMSFIKERIKADHIAGKPPQFEVGEDKLYYKCAEAGSGKGARTPGRNPRRRRIIVPESLRAFVIALHHNIELSAHQGHKRILKEITPKYYWPGMTADIKRWVAACSGCKRRKTPRPMRAGLNEPVLAKAPGEVWQVDLLGPLIETENGNIWALTMFDQFTRWPIAVPLPNTRQGPIMEALYAHLVCEKSVPKRIVTDQGRNLIAKAVKRMCSRWGIARIKTGGHNPTGNSCVERFHKYIGAAVTILMDRKTPDWDAYLPAILFAYRVSENDATGYSPFFLTTGREPTLPADSIFQHDNEEFANEHDFVEKTAGRLKKAFEYVRKKQYASAFANYERTAEKRYKPDYKKGDLLFLWEKASCETRLEKERRRHGLQGEVKNKLPQKFTNPWTGPYKMLEWIGENYCLIEKDGKEISYNVNRLSKFKPWDESNKDTFEWSQQRRRKLAKRGLINESPEQNEAKIEQIAPLQIGEVVVFPFEMSEDWPLPFGVGLVTRIEEDGTFEFQWMGNKATNPLGTFRLCWKDPRDDALYYATKATKPHHEPYLGDLVTSMKVSDIVVKGFHILGERERLTPGALKAIREDEDITSRATKEFVERIGKA